MKVMKPSRLHVGFVYSSKEGMLESLRRGENRNSLGSYSEPSGDLLAECDSDETITAVRDVLAEKYTVFPVESDDRAYLHLQEIRPDLVFNIAERLTGPNRESHIPTLCEMLGIPYTGSDPLTLGICLVKSRAKEILSYYGVPNPAFWVVDSPEELPDGIPLPVIVKPLFEGSSKGIRDNSVILSGEDLTVRVREIIGEYRQPVIIERFLTGREFTVGVLGNWPRLDVLPIVEIDHSRLPAGSSPIYSWEAKWVWDVPEKPLQIFRCPAPIDAALQASIEDVAIRAWRVLRIRDWARIDVRLDEKGQPHILEVNPLPGILPREEENSCLPKAARIAGYSYSDLIHRVVNAALERIDYVHA
ncbi:MAG TPA: D-alanine--D-alanine ligase [bacterium]|nr:D-alanine--D-alanine ligase [bacterium]